MPNNTVVSPPVSPQAATPTMSRMMSMIPNGLRQRITMNPSPINPDRFMNMGGRTVLTQSAPHIHVEMNNK